MDWGKRGSSQGRWKTSSEAKKSLYLAVIANYLEYTAKICGDIGFGDAVIMLDSHGKVLETSRYVIESDIAASRLFLMMILAEWEWRAKEELGGCDKFFVSIADTLLGRH